MKQRRIHSLHSTAVTAPGDSDGDGIWQKLMPAGRFSGRSGQGPFDTGDRRRMERIVAATLKRGAGTELVVDYDHQSVHASRVGGRASAAGWIKELQVRDDGIWGRIKWTEAATKAIRADEYPQACRGSRGHLGQAPRNGTGDRRDRARCPTGNHAHLPQAPVWGHRAPEC